MKANSGLTVEEAAELSGEGSKTFSGLSPRFHGTMSTAG